MSDNKSDPEETLPGSVDEVKGKAKEAVGEATGRDDLSREGRAEQDKARAGRGAAKKEGVAESARTRATASERRRRSNR